MNIVNDHIIPPMDFFINDDPSIFQDDNVRIHWAQMAKEWFQGELQSLDLNPMENLWDVLEKALCSGPTLSIEEVK